MSLAWNNISQTQGLLIKSGKITGVELSLVNRFPFFIFKICIFILFLPYYDIKDSLEQMPPPLLNKVDLKWSRKGGNSESQR